MGNRAAAVQMYNAGAETIRNPFKDYLQHSYKCFASACFADPTWSTAFYQAGNNGTDLEPKDRHLHSTVALYRRALQCEQSADEKARTLSNLGWQLRDLGRTQEALVAAEESTRLCPELCVPWTNLSLVYRDLNRTADAVRAARKGFELSENDANAEIAFAFALLYDRQFALGLKHFERRFDWALKAYQNMPYPRWDGEPNKVVCLMADQGLGDTLSFARFLRRACETSSYVHACVQQELLRLFQYVFADVKNLNILPGVGVNRPFPAADVWTTFVSLPHVLGFDDDAFRRAPHFGYPVALASSSNWKVQDRVLHVGIAWAGSPLNGIDRHRNIPVEQFYDLYRVPGVQLYAVQVGARQEDLAATGGLPLVLDLAPYIADVVDTISLVRQLDLVITCESALGHICALADTECWIPYSWLGKDYRIGIDGSDTIWAPKHRIFLQGASRNWQPAFDQMAAVLEERIAGISSGDSKRRHAGLTVA